MRNPEILYPVVALALWTLLVLCLMPLARFRAAFRGEVAADDFKFGESARVPPQVSIPNRNYMNLLESPTLFYVACVVLFVTAGASHLAAVLAWAYVALRVLHSVIHLTYNKVEHRLAVFALSSLVLLSLWVIAAMHLATAGR